MIDLNKIITFSHYELSKNGKCTVHYPDGKSVEMVKTIWENNMFFGICSNNICYLLDIKKNHIKLLDAKVGIRYIVKENTECETLQLNDWVRIEENMDLMSGYGWLTYDAWKEFGELKVELDREYYLNKIETRKKEIRECERVLERGE